MADAQDRTEELHVTLSQLIESVDDLKTELADRIARVGPSDETAGLEAECWELLKPLIEPKIPEYPQSLEEVRTRPYKCWTYALRQVTPRVGLTKH